APVTPVYSPVTTEPYPDDPPGILDLMVRYWLRQLRFRETIKAMYADGARIFIEVGPGNNLCGFVDDILRGKSVMSVASNTSRRSGTLQLCHLLGMLAAQHVDLSLEALLAAQPVHQPAQAAPLDGQPATKKAATVALDLGLPELRWKESGLAAWRKRLAPATPAAKKMEPFSGPASEHGQTAVFTAPFRPASESPANRRTAGSAGVMEKYLDNMSRFLELQQEMVLATTGRRQGPPAPGEPSARSVPPMVDKKTVLKNGGGLRIERDINLGRDIFLRDHPFGGDVSETNNRLSPLIVTPLTLNLEIMTEAAALLFPDKVLIGLRNGKASRWVVVDEESGVRLAAEARQDDKEEAAVRLYDLSGGRAASAESRVRFADGYPETVPVEPVPEKIDAPKARDLAAAMYAQKLMTHGPRFQVITALTLTDQNEMTAALRAPDDHNLFAAGQQGNFLLNPLLLDACAQMTGYWGQQVLTEGFITFPAGVGEIRFYTPPPRPGDRPWCRMRIREISDQLVRSDLAIGHADGRIWAHVNGWTHRRFELPAELYRFWRFPRLHLVGSVSKGTGSDDGAARCTAPYYDYLSGTIWQKAIAYLYLNPDERRIYKKKLEQDETAGRWLSQQIAAKDAVRIFLWNRRDRMVAPADITLRNGQNGYLFAESPLLSGLEQQLALSVTHDDSTVSVTVLPGKPLRKQEVG
ncbi:MAG: polyketide synthase dehydratase domain-containing protein, partial [Desulfosudaceae bacterium]